MIPAAPVSPDADLRKYPFTPIFRSRLFGSDFHALSTDAEWRAGVTLWLKSWDQVPAGSLPQDDIVLCRLAELGHDCKQWKKIKAGAMRGWVEHDDGRLYHPVVTEGVAEALGRRTRNIERARKAAEARYGREESDAPSIHDEHAPSNIKALNKQARM